MKEIVESDFFRELQQKAAEIRRRAREYPEGEEDVDGASSDSSL
ncbi:hypothetical protein GFS31_23470 [Leptolyngbya sp. BL0902]|nr:hypothetical protein GFS31_23470 [Leptolyngbya sp. BL0902]